MSEWISVEDRLPEATIGVEGKSPIISDDVFVAFIDGAYESYDVANYDHEDAHWYLVNRSFERPDADPTHWMPIPALPESKGAGR
jgi:hypothetical protein